MANVAVSIDICKAFLYYFCMITYFFTKKRFFIIVLSPPISAIRGKVLSQPSPDRCRFIRMRIEDESKSQRPRTNQPITHHISCFTLRAYLMASSIFTIASWLFNTNPLIVL